MCEGKALKKSFKAFLFVLVLLISGIMYLGQTKVHAATPGFVTMNGATYYRKANGEYQTGWLTYKGNKYYFFPGTKKMAVGWVKNSNGDYRYFKSNGAMATGWVVSGNNGQNKRYFNPVSGIMYMGLKKIGSYYYYFYGSNGCMGTGWKSNAKGQKRYFYSKAGYMATGWVTNSAGQKRFFNKTTGIMVTGWYNVGNQKRYFIPSTGYMATGTLKIDGIVYEFNKSTGYLIQNSSAALTGEKTIKNLLLAALQPVGSTLYVWAGGHDSDAMRKGLNPAWSAAYNSGSYAAGLDCSGYVGWSIYQIMNTVSTGWSGSMIDMYVSRGWGTKTPLSRVSKFMAGDVLAHGDHIWMILGQCSDGSVVVLHSSGTAGPQIAGTGGQAVVLAKNYMSKYSGYSKYKYDIWTDAWNSPASSYYNSTYVFRWNRQTLADPQGYTSKSANQILADLSYAIGD